ncbi:MAG: hypothetical protein NVS3B12_22790 [Acidimicrobiales bacterium]
MSDRPHDEDDGAHDGDQSERIRSQGAVEIASQERLHRGRHPTQRAWDGGDGPEGTGEPGVMGEQGEDEAEPEHGHPGAPEAADVDVETGPAWGLGPATAGGVHVWRL